MVAPCARGHVLFPPPLAWVAAGKVVTALADCGAVPGLADRLVRVGVLDVAAMTFGGATYSWSPR